MQEDKIKENLIKILREYFDNIIKIKELLKTNYLVSIGLGSKIEKNKAIVLLYFCYIQDINKLPSFLNNIVNKNSLENPYFLVFWRYYLEYILTLKFLLYDEKIIENLINNEVLEFLNNIKNKKKKKINAKLKLSLSLFVKKLEQMRTKQNVDKKRIEKYINYINGIKELLNKFTHFTPVLPTIFFLSVLKEKEFKEKLEILENLEKWALIISETFYYLTEISEKEYKKIEEKYKRMYANFWFYFNFLFLFYILKFEFLLIVKIINGANRFLLQKYQSEINTLKVVIQNHLKKLEEYKEIFKKSHNIETRKLIKYIDNYFNIEKNLKGLSLMIKDDKNFNSIGEEK